VAVALACVAAGILAAGLRAHSVAAPVLEGRYYGPIQGRIVDIDRSQSDALRLTLDRVVLDRRAPSRTPARVRVSLHGPQGWIAPEPGQVVILTGHLSAPPGPTEPGGFDFRRMAFFDRLGAVGYTRSPVLLWAPPAAGEQRINRLRMTLSAAVRHAIPGDPGAFAAGVTTGDRSALSLDGVEALRDSNLAHLLAISGMNLAFLTGFVFALVRTGLALVPPVALRIDTRKVAAVAALAVAWFYMTLSGANVATERAFVMAVVMLGGVLLDRRALTLRSLAVAGTVILVWQPEAMLEPGFQMSFAATAALIAGFAALDARVARSRLPRWVLPVYLVALSSVIGGFATAPYAAAHFNRFADYGLLANLLTVPVMGMVVMGSGVVALMLAPLGLEWAPLWVMGLGARWVLFVAHWIAGLDGAVTAIPAPGPWVLPLVTLGGAWAIAGARRARALAVPPLAVAAGLWAASARPPLLVAESGALAGLMTPGGRALSAPAAAGFAAETWLENDGDLAPRAEAAVRPGFDGPRGARRFAWNGWQGVVLTGRGAAGAVAAACATADLVIVAAPAAAGGPACHVIDSAMLRRTGAIALHAEGEALRLVPARGVRRLWSGPAPSEPERMLHRPATRSAAAAGAPPADQ
jgi:competence protein ComEC